MSEEENKEIIRGLFESTITKNKDSIVSFAEENEIDSIVDEARELFEKMIPTMAYLENPKLPMASALFSCNSQLSLFLTLRKRGVSVHQFGTEMLKQIKARLPPTPAVDANINEQERHQLMIERGRESLKSARPGEFVYEAFTGSGDDYDWGINIKSCAICHSFSQHDAADLVPYMCASDDVMSDKWDQGLRRTGSIGVGSHQCDFIYSKGGKPNRLAEQYPERIKMMTST